MRTTAFFVCNVVYFRDNLKMETMRSTETSDSVRTTRRYKPGGGALKHFITSITAFPGPVFI
jgi:hypothetical protein